MVVAGVVLAIGCWLAGLVPLLAASLTLLCDIDGECTAADTNQRITGLTITAVVWLASGPLAWLAGRRRWLLAASLVPFVAALPLVPYFIAGP
ncbi:MAG: hypothetical protein AAFN30_10715 [Actinomycetota bacterium]